MVTFFSVGVVSFVVVICFSYFVYLTRIFEFDTVWRVVHDAAGSKYAKDGSSDTSLSWWSDDTWDKFKRETYCFSGFYSNYKVNCISVSICTMFLSLHCAMYSVMRVPFVVIQKTPAFIDQGFLAVKSVKTLVCFGFFKLIQIWYPLNTRIDFDHCLKPIKTSKAS